MKVAIKALAKQIREENKMEANYKIKCETEGFDDAKEQIDALAEAYDGFPAQVVVKNCHDCKINIYPSQTKFVERSSDERPDKQTGCD